MLAKIAISYNPYFCFYFRFVQVKQDNADIKRLRQKIRNQQKTISCLRNQKTIGLSKSSKKKLVEDELKKYFSDAQAKCIIEGKKRSSWSLDDISTALVLRSLSKKTYKFIRSNKLFPLPGISTLQKTARKFDVSPGIQFSILDVLKKSVCSQQNSDGFQNLAVLCYDEVKIKEVISYHKQHDCVYGPHKNLQVAMLRGLVATWKQPIYMRFDEAMKKDLLDDIIKASESRGFCIVAIVSDLGPTNVGLWKSLNISPENTRFPNPADPLRDIYVFADVPHMLKLLRNHLLDQGFLLADGTKISVENVNSLLTTDAGEYRILHKLKPAHLTVKGSERQRVRPAAQILSHSVATAIRLVQKEERVADFFDTVNNWFDVLNSRIVVDSLNMKCAFGIREDQQLKAVEKMDCMIQSMKQVGAKSLKPYQKGILVSSRSIVGLFSMLKRDFNLKYILTSKLNQDCLENYFSRF